MITDGHQLKKEKNYTDTEGHLKKDQLKQKDPICKGALLSRTAVKTDAPRPQPVVLGGGAPTLDDWRRPTTEVTIKHFIFVNFFKFMISKRSKHNVCIYILYYVCNSKYVKKRAYLCLSSVAEEMLASPPPDYLLPHPLLDGAGLWWVGACYCVGGWGWSAHNKCSNLVVTRSVEHFAFCRFQKNKKDKCVCAKKILENAQTVCSRPRCPPHRH